jgi:uncharacterized protein (TIRG00374 family)
MTRHHASPSSLTSTLARSQNGARHRIVWRIGLALLAAGGVIALLAAEHAGFRAMLRQAGLVNPNLLLLAALFELLSMAAYARMQRRLLSAGGLSLTLASMLGITFAGNALAVSVPIAGHGLAAAYTYRELERRDVSRAAASFVPVASAGLSAASLMVLVAIGAIASGNEIAGLFGLLDVAAMAGLLVIVLLGLRQDWARRLLRRVAIWAVRTVLTIRRRSAPSAEDVVGSISGQARGLHLRARDWVTAAVFALMYWGMDALCLGVCIRAAGLRISTRYLLLAWSAGAATGSTGLTPGGLGIVEAALIAALHELGERAAAATIAVLAYRLISLWLMLVVGWVMLVVVDRMSREAAESAVPEPNGDRQRTGLPASTPHRRG